MGRWQGVEILLLKVVAGLAIAAYLALNSPKFFLLFGSLALVYALAPRGYRRLRRSSDLRVSGPVKGLASLGSSLGSRYERARLRRTKKRERRARYEPGRQDRQARLEVERIKRPARLAQEEVEEEPTIASTSEREREEARREEPRDDDDGGSESNKRRRAREEIMRYLERQRHLKG